MKSFWSPLSALFLPAPRIYAPLQLLKRALASGGVVDLVYAGDRMWPSFAHGELVRARALTSTAPSGSVVVACPGGVPELLRVAGSLEGEVLLTADADPGIAVRTTPGRILAQVESPRRSSAFALRILRRVLLDLREALRASSSGDDPASTVRIKYDVQAPYYAAAPGPGLEDSLRCRILESVPRGGRVLVAGSGTGRECFALAREGYVVSGVDFSAEMVSRAREEASRIGLPINFDVGDLRHHQESAGSLVAIVFTYEVYSFLPDRRGRIETLRSMARWLEKDGRIFLSARRLRGAYEAVVLSVQRLANSRGESRQWGDTHSRWIAPDGETRRSFLHVFPERSLRREVEEAGLVMGSWEGGHCMLVGKAASRRPVPRASE